MSADVVRMVRFRASSLRGAARISLSYRPAIMAWISRLFRNRIIVSLDQSRRVLSSWTVTFGTFRAGMPLS